jgi:hypothetical protein
MLTYADIRLQVLNEQRANLFEIIGCEDRAEELSMLRSALLQINEQVCSRMLTYAHICSRMLTYAHVC